MMLFNKYWIAVVMFAAVLAVPIKTMAFSPTIVISEVAWAGSSTSSSDEWIELTNMTNQSIDISGWYLTGASADPLILPEGSIMNPYSTYLISNYEQAHESSALGVASDYTTASVSLSNSGFALYLYDSDGSQVDVAGDGGAAFAGRSGGAQDTDDGLYRTMVRVDVALAGSNEAAWSDAEFASGFKEEVADYGTPGEIETWFVPSEDDLQAQDIATLVINEFVADPNEGEEEWIELFNQSDRTVYTTGWTIEDEIGGVTELESVSLEAGEYLVVSKPNGKLNNNGDTIVLKDLSGNVVDSITYGTEEFRSPKDGDAGARDENGVFTFTKTPTPGAQNQIVTELPEDEIVEEEVVVEEEVIEDLQEPTEDEPAADPIEDDLSPIQEEEVAIAYAPGVMLINEFMSQPDEGDEWVELVNSSSNAIDTQGWTLEDATGRTTELESMQLAPNEYLLVERPRGQLNNGGDTIILRDAVGTVIDTVSYGTNDLSAPGRGETAALDGGVFKITELPTPEGPNLIFVQLEPEDLVQESEDEEPQVEAPTEQEAGAMPATYSGPTTLKFKSVYPNTFGADADEEFVEIMNTGSEVVALEGWSIEDAATKRFTFEGEMLAPGTSRLIMRGESNIALNNLGDTLQLLSPNQDLVDQMNYSKASRGARYERVDNQWKWITGTDPDAKVVEKKAAVVLTSSVPTQKASTAPASNKVTVSAAKNLADGERVMITGIVTTAPGAFSKQTLYIQDATGGIQIYKHNGDYGEISVGDKITVTGELTTSYGERRVKVPSSETVVQTGSESTQARELSIETIYEEQVGLLIRTEGLVLSRSSNKVTIEDNGAQLVLYLNSSPPISIDQFVRGSRVSVTGVLTIYNGTLRLRPRSQEDIEIEVEEDILAGAISEPSGKDAFADAQAKAGWMLLLATVAMLGFMAMRRYLPARRKQAAA